MNALLTSLNAIGQRLAALGFTALAAQALAIVDHFSSPQTNQIDPGTMPPPIPSEIPVKPQWTRLSAFSLAIRDHEGWHPNSRSWRNNNPGNCRFSAVGYAPIYGLVRRDPDNFAIFKDVQTGGLYLNNLIKLRAIRYPHWTIYEFFAGRLQADGSRVGGYAPAADSNDPVGYSQFVAERIGVAVETPLTDALG